MALSLSSLTSPATSGDILQEINTTADFLEGVPLVKNNARGSQAGGSAKQDVALNQPRALPLDANGKGYLYLSGVIGNYASVPDGSGLNGTTNFVMEAKDVTMRDWASSEEETFFSTFANGNNAFVFGRNGSVIWLYAYYGGNVTQANFSHGLTGTATASVRLIRQGTSITAQLDTGAGYVGFGTAQTVPALAIDDISNPLEIGAYTNGRFGKLTGKIGQVRIWNNATSSGTPVLDVDFTATNVRHGERKFRCVTNQVVTINTAGLDPAKIIKRPVLRFDGQNDFMDGLLNQTVTGGYLFAAFSVLGDGGETFGRIFGMNSTGAADNAAGGFAIYREALTNNYRANYNGIAGSFGAGLFDDAMGDVLIESDFKNSSQIIEVNNADKTTHTTSGVLSAEEFKISFFPGGFNSSIDLEFLALFNPDSIPDEKTAQRIRNYINGRGAHPIFTLIDSAAFYFYDGTKSPVGAISSGSSAWSGRVVGSDNGDSASLLATQSTANDAPVGDGFKVTFADNTDHLDIPSISQSGWQICGTSLGTFVYKINGTTAVTELNLLGNLGHASYRKAGDLYGIILLPESATSADIESARRLLIDRGAADGATAVNYFAAWVNRSDIVEFKNVEFGSVINFGSAWEANSFSSFPLINASSGTYFAAAWFNCTSLNDFAPIQATLGNNFSNAWKSCTSLTSFPAGAKLGTAATNVNFTSAFQSSGLTSFPALDLSTGTNFNNSFTSSDLTSFAAGVKMGTAASGTVQFNDTWRDTPISSFPALDLGNGNFFNGAFRDCTSLTSFPSGIKLGTNKTGVGLSDAWRGSGLTSFPSDIDLSKGTVFSGTWRSTNLNSFSTPVPNGTSFYAAWRDTGLTDFSADVFRNWNPSGILSSVFDLTWDGCALSAQSVENILTSIDASGKYATSTGASGGTALADAAIDIDYNAASGSLSAATNSAVTSLKAKGWSIIVNNVTL